MSPSPTLTSTPLYSTLVSFIIERPLGRRFTQRKGFMSLPSTLSDPREICLTLNERTPVGGLFEGDRDHLHPNSNLPWRISPEPFWLSADELHELRELGTALHQFYRAANLLYHQSVKG